MAAETVEFAKVRQLWSLVNEAFGVENLAPPPSEQGGSEDLNGQEPEPMPGTTTELPKQTQCTMLRELAEKLIEVSERATSELIQSVSEISEPEILQDEQLHPILAAMGYTKPKDPFATPWTFSGAPRPMIEAVRHFLDTKLGQGHQSSNPSYAAVSMVMMGASDPNSSSLPPDPGVELDVDRLIRLVKDDRECPTVDEVKTLCYRAREVLAREDNIVCVDPPCTVVGDIHGQFDDLVAQVLGNGGEPGETRYVFLGDFVDRGNNSLLCMALILLYKLKHPNHVFLLRGNHESRVTNTMYGFHEECRQKYPQAMNSVLSIFSGRPESEIWNLFNHLFDALPLAALIGGKIFGCHGGLSPELKSLDRLLTFDRFQDILPQGPMADLTWSDPGMQEGWRLNVRGSGHAFGEDITAQFCEANGLDFVCRAHQCVKQGYRWEQNNRIVTIFSAPNYCWAQNKGAIMRLDESLNPTFVSYDQVKPEETQVRGQPPKYFNGGSADEDEDDDDGPPPPAPTKPDFSNDPSAPTDENRLVESEKPEEATSEPTSTEAPPSGDGEGSSNT